MFKNYVDREHYTRTALIQGCQVVLIAQFYFKINGVVSIILLKYILMLELDYLIKSLICDIYNIVTLFVVVFFICC